MKHFSFPENILESQKCTFDYKIHNLLCTLAYVLKKEGKCKGHENIQDYLIAKSLFIPRINKLISLNIEKKDQFNKLVNSMHKLLGLNFYKYPELVADAANLFDCDCNIDIKENDWNLRHYYAHKVKCLPENCVKTPSIYHKLRWKLNKKFPRTESNTIIFGPISQLSVGHLIYPLHALLYCQYLTISKKIEATTKGYISRHGYGIDLIHLLLKNNSQILECHNLEVDKSVSELADAITSDSFLLNMSLKTRIEYERFISLENNLIISNSKEYTGPELQLHLRTSNFKRDNNKQNEWRNSNINHINESIKKTTLSDCKINLMSADSFEDEKLNGINFLRIEDRVSSRRQWNQLAASKIFIGCLSGISHLDALQSGHILYLNVHSFITEFPIRHQHLFSMRRITTVKSQHWVRNNIDEEDLIYGMIYGFDRAFTAFSEFIALEHLNTDEMAEDINYFSLNITKNAPHVNKYTLQSLIDQLGYSNIKVPFRNISPRSYKQYYTFFKSIYGMI